MGGLTDEALLEYVLGIAPGKRLLYVPTAGMEDPARTVSWYERLHGRAEMTHLHFSPWPPAHLRELVLGQDIVLVAGGNTANALAIWRVHGFDTVLREAWERGIVLTGWSAGMICWFEHGVTDSFGPELGSMECLGFLPGSACPHYDGEERRRPVYTAARRSRSAGRPRSGRRRRAPLRRHRAARGRHFEARRDRLPGRARRRATTRGAAARLRDERPRRRGRSVQRRGETRLHRAKYSSLDIALSYSYINGRGVCASGIPPATQALSAPARWA